MGRFVEGQDRRQSWLLPSWLDDYVTEDNPVRVVEAFIDELDLGSVGFARVLRYNCDHAGLAYAEVDEANRNRTCSSCGCFTGPTGLAGLGIRRWTCSDCGVEHDRD